MNSANAFFSVGIDVGTTTTQVVFSRIFLEKGGGYGCVPEVKIAKKDVVYKSPIYFTPLISRDIVDAVRLKKIIAEEYRKSAIKTPEVTTGAVIITGESARKKNAHDVAEQLSEFAGDFVVCTAGPDYEAVLAGWGAGAGELSRKVNRRVANFDIGGGTTNAAVFFNSEVVETFAADIGGRLVKIDQDGTVSYVSEKIRFLAEALDLESVREGKKADLEELCRLAARMADMFPEFAGERKLSGTAKRLFIGHPSSEAPMECLMFSGGVAEYIYKTDLLCANDSIRRYGDIGPLLGQSIRAVLPSMRAKLLTPTEKIRATVVGAGNYSVGLSGSTISVSEEALPIKNVPVVKVSCKSGAAEPLESKIAACLRMYGGEQTAIAVSDIGNPEYVGLKKIAGSLLAGLRETHNPAVIITECDCAKALGLMLRNAFGDGRRVICLDRVHVENGDYIDIGKPLCGVVPVVVKSLIFS